MKNHLKSIFFFSLTLFCISMADNQVKKYIAQNPQEFVLSEDTVKVNSYQVTATMYYPVASQCDSDPLLTAGMYKIDPNHASEQKWIAMSRDMIERWGGEFQYGDYVQIKGAGHKDGIYKVVDTMNKRFKNRIDFLETKGTEPYKFENVTLTKWSTSTSSENALASL